MVSQDSHEDSSAALDFEREKWGAERAYRREELELKRRDVECSERRLRLEKQVTTKFWAKPVFLALIAAAAALFGNWYNGSVQLRLERKKEDSDTVLRVISSDTEASKKNFQFLLEAGLLSEDMQRTLRNYLSQTKPGDGPSLAAPSAETLSCPVSNLKSAEDIIIKFLPGPIDKKRLDRIRNDIRDEAKTDLTDQEVDAIAALSFIDGPEATSAIMDAVKSGNVQKAGSLFLEWYSPDRHPSPFEAAWLNQHRYCERTLFFSK